MANANPLRVGTVNQDGDDRALFLKIYGGMVVTAFRRRTAFMGRHIVRNIPHGKSAQFPRTGKVSARYHTPGEELLGTQSNQAEAVITVDDILVSDMFVPELDQLISHFDVKSEYATQQGEELANAFDMNVARMFIQAARSENQVDGLPGGEEIEIPLDFDVDTFADSLFEAQARLAEKDVPDSDRWCWVKPELYYTLVSSSSKAIHRDFGGDGSYGDGLIIRIAGLPIVMTNNLPTADDTSNEDIHEKYRGNYSRVRSIVGHRSAVGTVKLKDLSARVDYDPRRLGDLLVTKYLLGHGLLRPESAVVIEEATD